MTLVKQVSVGDITLAVVDQGQGTPVLFVHGFPLNHRMWEYQIEGLADKLRVIAPDLPGFGSSGPIAGKMTMEQFADALAEMLDRLDINEPVVFCGLSMGGYIAWQFWFRHQDKVRALILCDTRAKADTPAAASTRLQTAERVLKEGPDFLADTMIEKLFSPATRASRPDLVEKVRQMIRSTCPETIAAALRGMAERPDVSARLSEITCPALVIVGKDDSISPPAEMEEIARGLPNAHLVIVENAGHMAPMENPQPVNAAIEDFVASL